MILRNIFLPLDGSDLAESALPAAVFLTRLYGASVTLFHVIEKGARDRIHASRHLTRPDEADEYLRAAAARYLPPETSVARHVHKAAVRNVAVSIADHTREIQPDLIVLCAHGNSGPRDWLIGNIAQQVIARVAIPVLLLRPQEAPAPDAVFTLRSILLPIDGVPEHECGGVPAEDLARKSGAALHLATVVPTPDTLAGENAAAGRFLPASAAELLDLNEGEARAYLARRLEPLQANGLKATAQVLRGDPATELANLAGSRRDDLIVLGTHGKAGSTAFWNRSVTARVLGRIKIPALLVPVR